MIELAAFCEVLFEVVAFVDGVVYFVGGYFAVSFDYDCVDLDDDAPKAAYYDFDDAVVIISFIIMAWNVNEELVNIFKTIFDAILTRDKETW